MRSFLNKFRFQPEGSLLVGIERECHLIDKNGNIAPLAEQVLNYLGINERFGYELSACQLEDRVGPCKLEQLKQRLFENETIIRRAERALKFSRSFSEVGPDNMPLDVYPDPTGRYQKIVKSIPGNILLAACQVIGIHVHIGMPDHATALHVYNKVLKHIDILCKLGDRSDGRRLAIYSIMAPNNQPPSYTSWKDYYDEAVSNGFETDPRKCWHLIRISVHGTIEFRMFGSTGDLNRIVDLAKICYEICQCEMV